MYNKVLQVVNEHFLLSDWTDRMTYLTWEWFMCVCVHAHTCGESERDIENIFQ